MKQKLVLSVLLTLILSVAMISAAISVSTTTPASLTKTITSTSFTVTNQGTENSDISITLPTTISDGKGHSITLSTNSTLTFENVAPSTTTAPIYITYSGDTTNFFFGEFSSNIAVRGVPTVPSNSSNVSITVPLKFINTLCKYGENASNLDFSDISINNENGDDLEWKPLDSVKIKVKVENNGDEKVSSVNVEMGLYNSAGKNVVNDLESLSNKKIDYGSISDGKSTTKEFTFTVPGDFEDDTYYLVFKVYKSGKEANICKSTSADLESTYYQTITGTRETDEGKQVVVDNIVISPQTAQCSDKVQVTAEVLNIGDTDYEDQVKVTLYNKELGLNTEQLIREDLNMGDSATVDFEFDVPNGITEKSYNLDFKTYYDYNSDDDTYNQVSDKVFSKTLIVQGNCVKETPASAKITAQLDPETPEAIAGKQIIIDANLKNTGTVETDYDVSVYGNTAWSNLVSLEPKTFTLAGGESKDIVMVLNIDPTALGNKEFTIKATYGNKTTEQKVALTVNKEEVQTSAFLEHLKTNWFIYLIIIVNIILIIAIIAVVRRMLAPREM